MSIADRSHGQLNALHRVWKTLGMAVVIVSATLSGVRGEVSFVLKNGMVLRGRVGPRLTSISENAMAEGEVKDGVRPIVFLDDGLRRTFVPWQQIDQTPDDGAQPDVIKISQRVAKRGERLAGIRDVVSTTPFDEFARRTLAVGTPHGVEYIVQGITEISPVYIRVEGLVGKKSVICDSRLATSSLPRDTLLQILHRQHKSDSSEGYLATARLLLSSGRYSEANAVLDQAVAAFPQLGEGLKGLRKQLHVQAAEQLLQEIELRRSSGRVLQARQMLEQFPVTDEDAGEVLVQVRDRKARDQQDLKQVQQIVAQIQDHAAKVEDPLLKPVIQAFQEEVARDLSPNNMDRFADFLNLSHDREMEPAQKLALALSGWLLGSGGESATLTRVASLWEARELVTKYLRLRGSQEGAQREAIVRRLSELEGTNPANVARLLTQLLPPGPPLDGQQEVPGLFRVQVGSRAGGRTHRYYVQLPPEYDPYRRYPVIVTLHRPGSSPLQQLLWWCGPYDDRLQERLGQATRHGYIVIAPEWATEEQTRYEFSAQEHQAVLSCLRDAFYRLSIDSDRVFLSGHSTGGDAAWDIAGAHPDLWAGVIPIVATAEYNTRDAPKYIPAYISNARTLPFYFVCGEMDGDLTFRNSVVWDRYMRGHYNTIVAEFRGRGHEMFGDEIQRIMTWANLCRRDFFPREFDVVAMRPWDNFFWCVELNRYIPKSMMMPLEWEESKPGPKAKTEVKIPSETTVVVRSAAKEITLYLAPEMVDFSKPLIITIDGKTTREPVEPSIATMLEDARTRADRQHPFWAKIVHPRGARE